MPNKNNKKDIELLPEELRKKEEKKEKKEEKPEVKFYIPPEEKKPAEKKISFFEKIFGTKEEREKKKLERQKIREEELKKKEKEEKILIPPIKEEKEEKKIKIIPSRTAPGEKKEKVLKPLEEKPVEFKKPSIEVTLMPKTEIKPEEMPLKKRLMIGLGIVTIFGCILGGLYLGLFFYEKNFERKIKIIENEEKKLKEEIAVYEKDKKEAQELQERFQAMEKILSEHIYWTNFFEQLEKNTVSDVYYTDFMGSSNGAVSLSAVGKNYTSVAKQLVAFREADFVESVSITGATAQVGTAGEVTEVNFEIQLKVKPQVFLK